jgi:hypothetical protein
MNDYVTWIVIGLACLGGVFAVVIGLPGCPCATRRSSGPGPQKPLFVREKGPCPRPARRAARRHPALPTFSEIYVAALKALLRQIAGGGALAEVAELERVTERP